MQFPTLQRDDQIVPRQTVDGFSGAAIWRLESPRGTLCLRAWPPDMRDGTRLAWLHTTLRAIYQCGCHIVPVPLETTQHATWVDWEDRFWELTPWMPGRADYCEDATPRRLRSALAALARFHACAAQVEPPGVVHGRSPALRRREELLRELRQGLYDQLCDSVAQQPSGALTELAGEILGRYQQVAPRVTAQMQSVLGRSVPLQICHGDLWHDHLLFTGERVTGLIDFGNLRLESPTSDVARLLGSLAGDDSTQWQIGLEAYEELHRLNGAEHALLRVFDQTTVLLSGINWLRWIYIDRRQFTPWPRVEKRLKEIVARLNHL